MFGFFIKLILFVPGLLIYSGNIILYYVFGREVNLNDDSFAAYCVGIVVFFLIIELLFLLLPHSLTIGN